MYQPALAKSHTNKSIIFSAKVFVYEITTKLMNFQLFDCA